MPLERGFRLGSYEVLAPLGSGGMGEVYRATDPRLKRDVAIKVLPGDVADDVDRLARFRREAELLASLNHTNIAAIYGLEQVDRLTAIVLELVEGETLAEQIARGPIATGDAVPIMRQIAEALEAAHDKGVIHRDLKPANIKVTPDGTVKVLDFGLAKLAPVEGDSGKTSGVAALSMSPTLSIHATYAGVILGTAAYMSPEQAKGRTVDKRSDVWAWGCVFYEALTGRRPFEGEDVADTIAFVLTREPDWSLLPAQVPPSIQLLLRRCLEKDRKRRIADISTARFVLDEPTSVAGTASFAVPPVVTSPVSMWKRAAAYAAAVVAGALATAVVAWTVMISRERTAQVSRFTIVPPPTATLNTAAPDRPIAISPDGSHIIYRAGVGTQGAGQMVVRAIDQLDGRTIAGVQGFREPVLSPDGRWIAFQPRAELRKVSITGGPSILLCAVKGAPRGASWGANDTIVFATDDTSTGLMSVPAAGGEPRMLTKPDPTHGEGDHVFPSMLPGGTAVLFTITAPGQTETSQVAVLDLRSGRWKILIRGGSQAEYVESGHLVYAAAGSLRAVRFDLKRLEVLSDPIPVVEDVRTVQGGEASFAVSRTGTLVYVPGGVNGGQGAQRSFVWVNRQGREEPIKAPLRAYTYPRLSPDGSRLAIDVRDQDNDIWIWDFARDTLTRLTFDPAADQFPIWTPDSRAIIFASSRAGIPNLYRQSADGTGQVERLTTAPVPQLPTSIAPDGKRLVLNEANVGRSGLDLSLLALQGQPRSEPLIQTMFTERNAEISADGRWIAYESDESGRFEVYVRPFPNVESGRWQISTNGGTRPLWARSGRELFYLDRMGPLMLVTVQATDTTFRAGNPVKLFDTRYFGIGSGNSGRTYDVSPDGQRFLMIKETVPTDQGSTAQAAGMVVVLNWIEELKRLVPAK